MRKAPNIISLKQNEFMHYMAKDLTAPSHQIDIIQVGAGGTGGKLVLGLAQLNYALKASGHPGFRLHLFDEDIVTEANIGRQNYAICDIGANKAVTQISRINNAFPSFAWKAYPMMFRPTTINAINREVPLIIGAVDKGKARAMIHNSCHTKSLYYLDTGNTRVTGQVILGSFKGIPQPKSAACIDWLPTVVDLYPDIHKADANDKTPSCSSFQAAIEKQDLFINQQVATSALKLLWSAFHSGKISISGYFINFNSINSEKAFLINPETYARMGWNRPQDKTKRSGRAA